MKTLKIALLGIILSLIILIISANFAEGGDTNAVLMYLVVFSLPVILLAITNAIYLFFVDKFVKSRFKGICGIIPILFLIALCFQKKMPFPEKVVRVPSSLP